MASISQAPAAADGHMGNSALKADRPPTAKALVENLGYRQLNDLWRMIAFVDLGRRKQGWGAQKRRGIGNLATAETPAHQPLTKRS